MKLIAEIPRFCKTPWGVCAAKLRKERFRYYQDLKVNLFRSRTVHLWDKETSQPEAERIKRELKEMGICCRIE